MDAIRTDSLTKYYGTKRGIDGITLSVKEGDFFGFIGPNGAGKSTTIRTLLGLITKTSGSAEVLGHDISKDKIKILQKVGYLPSEVFFYNDMTAREILELSAKLRHADCRAEASVLCDMLEIDRNKKIGEMSLGNKKKVGIVCALQHKPELYILDEATSGLDPLMQKEFFSLLKQRNAEGATVFLSSHILSEVEKHCGSAAVIKDGKIVFCDKVSALSHTGAKRVTLRGKFDRFEIKGAEKTEATPDGITFLFSGSMNELTGALSKIDIEDMTVTDPDLEEIFMHFYAKEEK